MAIELRALSCWRSPDSMHVDPEGLFAALRGAGLSDVPECFSVSAAYQRIPSGVLLEIDRFIAIFERITTRPAWQETVTTCAPELARPRRESCFFNAWDFHLPPGEPERWQLIEFNDNGSGFLFSALINRVFYEFAVQRWDRGLEIPDPVSRFEERIVEMMLTEAQAFFGHAPSDSIIVLDEEAQLRTGRFRLEMRLLRDVFRRQGWKATLASPSDFRWTGEDLRHDGGRVSVIINRLTDFLWQGAGLAAVRAAYESGSVYVAPNPFSYATRSDKRLLEFLSLPHWDDELGIQPEERGLLSMHVPETRLVREENLEELAARRQEFVFKPTHGFAGRGVLRSSQVGRSRLRRLLRKEEGYVAQRRVAKSVLQAAGRAGPCLWADLRVWAHRGRRFLLGGRASKREDVLDLEPPGGWLATYARMP